MRLFARSLLVAPLAVLVPAFFFACSSSSSATSSSTTSTGATTTAGSTTSTGTAGGGGSGGSSPNCVKPGTPNNAEGLGGYCTPDGGECGSTTICTASVPGVPTNAWFCTLPCTATTNCGEGLSCITSKLGTLQGSGCVPASCDFLAIDGGTGGGGGAGGSGSSACTGSGVGGAGGGTTAATGSGGTGGADAG